MSKGEHVVGNSRRNLVLKTAGSIRVLVGDKYYSLNFKGDSDSSKNIEDEEELESLNEDVDDVLSSDDELVIIDSIDGYKYPGDGKVIMTLDGKIYYTSNNSYNEYLNNIEIPSSFHNTINFNNTIPFKVNSSTLIQNLNANYLDGYRAEDFILNGRTLKFNHVIVNRIESDDGVLKYNDGSWSLKQFIPNIHFLNNKVHISKGFNVKESEEIEYSKCLPYENTLLSDLLKAIIVMDKSPYYYISNLLNYDIDLSYISELPDNAQIDELNKMGEVLFSAKDSDIWNEEVLIYDEHISLNNIRLNVVDIDKLRFHKSSFILHTDNTDGINIYDEFKAEIRSYYKTDLSGNIYDLCYDGDSYIKYNSNIVNCIVTKIDRENNIICVTTDYESEMFKNSVIDQVYITYGDNKYYYNNYYSDLCGIYDVFGDYAYSGNDIIGDLTGEVVDGVELSGHGVLMNDNCYILNSNIYTSVIKESNVINSIVDSSEITKSQMNSSLIENSEINKTICNELNINESSINNSNITTSNISDVNITDSDIENSNITDCNITNSIKYLNINYNNKYYIEPNIPGSYSIYNDNGIVILENSNVNGILINLYAINNVDIRVSDEDIILESGSYTSYRNIPVSDNEYKWIKIN